MERYFKIGLDSRIVTQEPIRFKIGECFSYLFSDNKLFTLSPQQRRIWKHTPLIHYETLYDITVSNYSKKEKKSGKYVYLCISKEKFYLQSKTIHYFINENIH